MKRKWKKKTRIVPLYATKKYALEVLGEISGRTIRKQDGQGISEAEDWLLGFLHQQESHFGIYQIKNISIVHKLRRLGVTLDIYPIPDWYVVKRRMFPEPEDTYYRLNEAYLMFPECR